MRTRRAARPAAAPAAALPASALPAAALPGTALQSAWQGALAAEQQATFGYGLLGPRLTGAQRSRAGSDQAAHAHLRDTTAAAIGAAGLDPVAPQADYPRLYPVADDAAARRLALRLEGECADAWRALYFRAASTTGATATALRGTAQQALVASAVRAAFWRVVIDPKRATDPFPGI